MLGRRRDALKRPLPPLFAEEPPTLGAPPMHFDEARHWILRAVESPPKTRADKREACFNTRRKHLTPHATIARPVRSERLSLLHQVGDVEI